MSSSYNCKHPRGVMSVSKGKPKPTKVLSSGKGNFATPACNQKPGYSQGGSKK